VLGGTITIDTTEEGRLVAESKFDTVDWFKFKFFIKTFVKLIDACDIALIIAYS